MGIPIYGKLVTFRGNKLRRWKGKQSVGVKRHDVVFSIKGIEFRIDTGIYDNDGYRRRTLICFKNNCTAFSGTEKFSAAVFEKNVVLILGLYNCRNTAMYIVSYPTTFRSVVKIARRLSAFGDHLDLLGIHTYCRPSKEANYKQVSEILHRNYVLSAPTPASGPAATARSAGRPPG